MENRGCNGGQIGVLWSSCDRQIWGNSTTLPRNSGYLCIKRGIMRGIGLVMGTAKPMLDPVIL